MLVLRLLILSAYRIQYRVFSTLVPLAATHEMMQVTANNKGVPFFFGDDTADGDLSA